MRYLSLCAIAKNEAPYIWEWVLFHLGVGVDHIYLYDNDSADLTIEWAKKAGGDRITIEKVPGKGQQIPTYHRCLKQYKNDTRWMALLDCDEFLVPQKVDNVKEVLVGYEEFPGLCPHWLLFGSNGEVEYKPIPVVERFTKRGKDVNQFVKSIVDPQRTLKASSPINSHKFIHSVGAAVRENFQPLQQAECTILPGVADIIAINHYVTKSYGECLERRSKPTANLASMPERVMPAFFDGHNQNDVEDLRALNLWRKICQQ